MINIEYNFVMNVISETTSTWQTTARPAMIFAHPGYDLRCAAYDVHTRVYIIHLSFWVPFRSPQVNIQWPPSINLCIL